ncbi:hypothetical protein C9I89_20815 [Photobacterium lipolyticum]|uniref:Uncharacterized protein n=1 Tax=Photobacterium lipolyticum TaxID=266810 RepID=A0A2T3MSF2_9GAMM|nr:hypothetical protein C9I89_20815 [Photobacterium lipolyticum]
MFKIKLKIVALMPVPKTCFVFPLMVIEKRISRGVCQYANNTKNLTRFRLVGVIVCILLCEAAYIKWCEELIL